MFRVNSSRLYVNSWRLASCDCVSNFTENSIPFSRIWRRLTRKISIISSFRDHFKYIVYIVSVSDLCLSHKCTHLLDCFIYFYCHTQQIRTLACLTFSSFFCSCFCVFALICAPMYWLYRCTMWTHRVYRCVSRLFDCALLSSIR